ncbi:MAG TPA: chemotaxis protein CheA, partial [Gammaproteobacteria bacterium]|nr:chemotaxis protein CheA [Gammaproteobacteria bacterium]
SGEELPEARADLLTLLDQLLENKSHGVIDEETSTSITDQQVDPVEKDMDQEFESMLAIAANTSGELISDDEFDAVLDSLHGKGKHGQLPESSGVVKPETGSAVAENPDDLISEEEFEAELDKIYGEGKGPGNNTDKLHDTGSPSRNQEIKNNTTSNVSSIKTAKNQSETTVRVDTSRLDDIMNLVGELVLVRNRLTNLKQEVNNGSIVEAISTLELVTSELQSSVMKTRMQPIKKVFSRFPRVIRELARKLDKDINLELIGEDTDLDKSLVEALADPLIHLVRNAADHGIESPQQRFESGKSRQGQVTLKAQQEGDQVLLTITDDGHGMDHRVLRNIAVEKGLLSEEAAKKISDKEAYNLIFAPGFSTKKTLSDVSGRGVGMDVVKTRINELNGNVEIDSELGKGSIITITLPLTLAILPTLMVKLDEYQFALPLSNVYEAFNMNPEQINIIDGQNVIRVRDKPLPLFYLNPWLVQHEKFDGPQESQKVIVVQMGNQRFCLVVDQIAGQEEVVIKPLGTMLGHTLGFSGATITGDGSIALIIDVPSLMSAYAANSAVY